MICASLAPKSASDAAEALRRADAEGADLAELRLDRMPRDRELDAVLQRPPLPVIVTVRPTWEGGGFEGPENDRILRLRHAAAQGADFLDIEFRAYKDIHDLSAKKIISYHDFEGMPQKPGDLLRKMALLNPAVVKLAVTPHSTADLLELCRYASRGSPPRCVIGMGKWGEPLRILYGKFGLYMTYAALNADSATALGQLSVRELRELYRAHEIDEDTEVYAVVGNPVAHSLGPALWNRAFRAMGRRAVYVRIPLDDAALLPELIQVFGLRGVSVTLPHKEAVIKDLDEIDPAARRIGSVNTIAIRPDGKRAGSNTDWIGAIRAIREAAARRFGSGSLKGRTAIVFGAGGTARALVHGLVDAGAKVTAVNRTRGRAEELGREFNVEAAGLEEAAKMSPPDVIAQTTRVGMEPDADASVVPGALLKRDQVCFDAVYTPPETRFLREAKAAGAETASGVTMFVHQAAAQFEAFLGESPSTQDLLGWFPAA